MLDFGVTWGYPIWCNNYQQMHCRFLHILYSYFLHVRWWKPKFQKYFSFWRPVLALPRCLFEGKHMWGICNCCLYLTFESRGSLGLHRPVYVGICICCLYLTFESCVSLGLSWPLYVGHLYLVSVSDIWVMRESGIELAGICGACACVVCIWHLSHAGVWNHAMSSIMQYPMIVQCP